MAELERILWKPDLQLALGTALVDSRLPKWGQHGQCMPNEPDPYHPAVNDPLEGVINLQYLHASAADLPSATAEVALQNSYVSLAARATLQSEGFTVIEDPEHPRRPRYNFPSSLVYLVIRDCLTERVARFHFEDITSPISITSYLSFWALDRTTPELSRSFNAEPTHAQRLYSFSLIRCDVGENDTDNPF